MIDVTIGSRVELNLSQLSEDHVKFICERTTFENPEYFKAKARSVYTDVPRFYRLFQLDREKGTLSICRGALSVVRDMAKAFREPLKFHDERIAGTPATFPSHKRNLYPYQEAAVTAAIERQNCLIRAPTGSGKTTAAIALAARLGLPTLIIVWSANLLNQWVERIQSELGLPKHEIGIIQGKTVKLRNITVGMQQSIVRSVDQYADVFGVVICDEVQRFAAKTFIECIDPFKAKYRIGISADETRKDKKEFLIYSIFGAVAADIKREDLIKSKHVLDVTIKIVPTEYEDPEYQVDKNFNRLLNGMKADLARNKLITDFVIHHVKRSEQCFVLSHRREHCAVIESNLEHSGVRSGSLVGGLDNKAQFEATKKGLLEGTTLVGVGTIPAIGQGLDIPSVSVAIVASPIANNRQQFGQVRGRVCRTSEGKGEAILYYLWDQHIYGSFPIENLLKWNSSVKVLHEGNWVDAATFLKKRKKPPKVKPDFLIGL